MRGSRNFCQFYLILSLFYSLQRGSNGFIAEKTIHFPGGSGPLFPSGSAHGQCHDNGTIFITVPLLTMIAGMLCQD